MNIAHTIFETVRTLPEDKAKQVLALAESLQQQEKEDKEARRKKALAELEAMGPMYTVTPYTRDELYDRKVFR